MEIEKLLLQYRQFSMLNVRKQAPKNTCSHTCYPGTEEYMLTYKLYDPIYPRLHNGQDTLEQGG